MNSTKFNRSQSQPRFIIRKSVINSEEPQIDPFRFFTNKNTRTPLLKPTCHKINIGEKSLKKVITTEIKPVSKLNLEIAKISSSVFNAKQSKFMSTFNPSFSAKTYESRSSKVLYFKPIYKGRIVRIVREPDVKNTQKIPSLNKNVIRRFNSLVFKKRKPNRSALDFSFADPD